MPKASPPTAPEPCNNKDEDEDHAASSLQSEFIPLVCSTAQPADLCHGDVNNVNDSMMTTMLTMMMAVMMTVIMTLIAPMMLTMVTDMIFVKTFTRPEFLGPIFYTKMRKSK